jgi:hypothetical protein
LAEWDTEVLAGLLSDADLGDVGFTDEEMKRFVGNMGADEDLLGETEIHESFEVVAECRDEEQQKQLYERLRSEGYSCRLFTL